MTLAANLPNASLVCVTETRAGGALKWLARNVARNEDGSGTGGGLWRPGVVHVEACDWTAYGDEDEDGTDTAVTSKADSAPKADDEDESCDDESTGVNPRLEAMEWDVLVGSDLVYDDDGVRYLPRVVRHFLRNNEPRIFSTRTQSTGTSCGTWRCGGSFTSAGSTWRRSARMERPRRRRRRSRSRSCSRRSE